MKAYGFITMKTHMGKSVAAALVGLATIAVTVTQAGDAKRVSSVTNSINAPVADTAATFRALDRNGDGTLSVTEFSRVDRELGRLQISESGIPSQFGYVTRLAPFWSYQDLTFLFQLLDTNRDGALSPAEFARINEIAADFTGY